MPRKSRKSQRAKDKARKQNAAKLKQFEQRAKMVETSPVSNAVPSYMDTSSTSANAPIDIPVPAPAGDTPQEKKEENTQVKTELKLLERIMQARKQRGIEPGPIEKMVVGLEGQKGIRQQIQDFASKNKALFDKSTPEGMAARTLYSEAVSLSEDALSADREEAKRIYDRLQFILDVVKQSQGDQSPIAKNLEEVIKPVRDAIREKSGFGAMVKERLKGYAQSIPERLLGNIPIVGDLLAQNYKENREGKERVESYSGRLYEKIAQQGKTARALEEELFDPEETAAATTQESSDEAVAGAIVDSTNTVERVAKTIGGTKASELFTNLDGQDSESDDPKKNPMGAVYHEAVEIRKLLEQAFGPKTQDMAEKKSGLLEKIEKTFTESKKETDSQTVEQIKEKETQNAAVVAKAAATEAAEATTQPAQVQAATQAVAQAVKTEATASEKTDAITATTTSLEKAKEAVKGTPAPKKPKTEKEENLKDAATGMFKEIFMGATAAQDVRPTAQIISDVGGEYAEALQELTGGNYSKKIKDVLGIATDYNPGNQAGKTTGIKRTFGEKIRDIYNTVFSKETATVAGSGATIVPTGSNANATNAMVAGKVGEALGGSSGSIPVSAIPSVFGGPLSDSIPVSAIPSVFGGPLSDVSSINNTSVFNDLKTMPLSTGTLQSLSGTFGTPELRAPNTTFGNITPAQLPNSTLGKTLIQYNTERISMMEAQKKKELTPAPTIVPSNTSVSNKTSVVNNNFNDEVRVRNNEATLRQLQRESLMR
jgi:hypothetical protein